jgi:hypothetical protein
MKLPANRGRLVFIVERTYSARRSASHWSLNSRYMITSRKMMGRRVVRILGFLVAGILAVWLCIYVSGYVRVVRLDDIFDPKYGYRVGLREEYFSRDFPNAKDIESYLFDSTLLISNPPLGNGVYYFDKDHKYLFWHENLIEAGKWWVFPSWQLIRLGNRWRLATVQTFCALSFALPTDAQQDNCYFVETTTSLLGQGHGSEREYRKGNVLGLLSNQQAPFRLPTSAITINSLLSSLTDKNQ